MYLNVRFSIRLNNGKHVFFVRKDDFSKAEISRVIEHLRASGADPSRATLYLCMMLSASYSARSVEVRWINEIE